MRRPAHTTRIRLLALALLASAAYAAPSSAAQIVLPAATLQSVQNETSFTASLDAAIAVRSDHTAQKTETVRVKVFSEAAIQLAGQQSLAYIDNMQSLDIVEAYTQKSDGRKIPVDLATVITRDAATGLGGVYLRDLKLVTVIFPDVAVGDTIVYTTRVEHKSGVFAGHFFDQTLFQRAFPFADSTVRVSAPKEMALKVAVYGDGIEHATQADETETRHVITYRRRPKGEIESGQTSPLDRDPRVFVSTFKDYEDQAGSYWQMARLGVEVTPEIAGLADEITQGIGDRRAQAEAIATWVKRNIRYVAVYLGTARVMPNRAASVLKNRYGDCKDHAALMSALLAAKGIATEHVLISAGTAYTLPDPPTMAYINHVMIYLPEFGVYDDPTSSYAAFGVLAEQTYDKPVVHVSDSGAYRARTPAMQPDDHVSVRRTRVTVAADGTVSGETEQTATGIFASGARRIAVNLQSDGLERSAEKRLRTEGTPGKGSFEIGSLAERGDTYTVTGRFVLDKRVKIAPAGTLDIPNGLPIQVRPGNYLLNVRYENRTLPFVCLAGRQREEIEVTFADGLLLPNGIKGRRIETASFVYTADYKLEDRTLKVRREFTSRVPGQVCAPEIEAEIADPLKQVKGSLTTKMGFKGEPKRPLLPVQGPADKPDPKHEAARQSPAGPGVN